MITIADVVSGNDNHKWCDRYFAVLRNSGLLSFFLSQTEPPNPNVGGGDPDILQHSVTLH